jgi:hypothetical protein
VISFAASFAAEANDGERTNEIDVSSIFFHFNQRQYELYFVFLPLGFSLF